MKIVFIGSGNMGCAMMKGMVASGEVAAADLIATAAHGSHFAALQALGIETTTDNRAAAAQADVLFLAIKPYQFADVVPQICAAVPPEALIVSIAAGQTLAGVQALFGGGRRIVRLLPNTPAMVGESMTAYCKNELVTEADCALVRTLSACYGVAEEIPERLMNAVIGLTAPASVYLFIEALADGAVREGLPRAQAYRFAAQTVLGAAKMVRESGRHPGTLKDDVCSPGGTTIEGIAKLEECGLRHAVIAAVHASTEKAARMDRG